MKNRFFLNAMFTLLFYCAASFLGSGPQAQEQNQSALPAQPPTEGSQSINAPPLVMTKPGEFEIGGVRILKKSGRVEFPAKVNMAKGLLEYLIVGGAGKLHESLLRAEVEPYSLQIALLLLGLEGTMDPLGGQGDPRQPEGDPVSIWVRWKDMEMLRIEQWVLNKKDNRPMEPGQWIFTGSFVADGVFMAQVEKSIVAVYRDPVAMIDNPHPDATSDEVWFVNEGHVPPPGTGVTVIIQKESLP